MTAWLPADATLLDAVAFVWFVALWGTYNVVMDRFLSRLPVMNRQMALVRRVWMERFLDRDNRIMDGQLLGHTIGSVTFFASTTMLVVAGIVGVLGAVDAAYEVVMHLGFTARTSKAFFELKLLLLVAILAYAFFKFTWALRQYNYTCALLGSAPLGPLDEATRRAVAGTLSDAISASIGAFNGGLRSYYFALAALTWFIQPWAFMAATAWVVGLLLYRQLASKFFHAVKRHGMLVGPDRGDADRS
ncbi:DUF599 domain-containing protein [Arenibaculum sp.]|uniref:DUF599 domain-containing protein n=1 Tax=Arenibaculum sp. TaxID=2865862 RepID=UPI002E0E6D93|nr:DUF599 family protein [Arenibaculum sp.]